MKKYTLKKPQREPTTRIDYRAALNDQQYEVVSRQGGPALIIAGAGSGKTRTITYRVSWLIEHGVDPDRILLMTFTNRAAREMLRRVEGILQGQVRKVWGGTFHHLGNRVLRTYGERLGYRDNFTILDRDDQKDLMQVAMAALKLEGKGGKRTRFPRASVIVNMASSVINTQKNLSDVVMEQYPYFTGVIDEIRDIIKAFQQRKLEVGAVDFDDLLLAWKRLLEEHPDVLEAQRRRFQHILVDEYQDTNKLQAEIVDLLGAPTGNVMVVGDDCQSIYSFRGANFGNILTFPERYPTARVHRLEKNYRSVPEILELANRVIEHNTEQFEKTLAPVRTSAGQVPVLVPARDVRQQAEFLVQRVLELRDEGESLQDMAVLYRAHSHSVELQVELARAGIPFRVRSGVRFFEQAHIKDVIAHLRVIDNPADELAWNRVTRLFPRIGHAAATAIFAFIEGATDATAVLTRMQAEGADMVVQKAARQSWGQIRKLYSTLATPSLSADPGTMIELVAGGSYREYVREKFPNARTRLEDLEQLATFAATYPDTRAFLSEMVTLTDLTAADLSAPGETPDEFLTLSTVHRAKGLEWGVVFVPWVADGKFPSQLALGTPEAEEEERRLFYVAVTRAKDLLHLVYPLTETLRDGRELLQRPSRFIREIPETTYESWLLEE